MLRKSASYRHRPEPWQRIQTLRSLKQAHALTVVRSSPPSSLRELLFSAAICIPGALPYALKLFDTIPHPDLFMWNTIIRASPPFPALSLFLLMLRRPSSPRPDLHTLVPLLRAASLAPSPSAGRQLHAWAVTAGHHAAAFARNSLIAFYASCGDLRAADSLFDARARADVVAWSAMVAGHARRGSPDVARKLFDQMPSRDLVSWNVMITAYAKAGRMDSARELFDRFPDRDVVSWNTMIAGYAKCGMHAKALSLFEEMMAAGMRPDQVTILSLLSACADSGALEFGKRLHETLTNTLHGTMSLLHGNTLIDMYSKCGCIERALDVFHGMKDREVSTWNSVIGGLAFHGHVEECVRCFRDMLQEGLVPNEITFVGVMMACSHGGMVEEGREYYSLMVDGYGIKPNIKHYGCMVDLLGRAGRLVEAFEFVKGMDVEPNDVVWRALLGACHLHGNLELARIANEKLLKLEQDASGDYILLSNIYASMGEWGGVLRIREMMDERKVPKEAGCSLVDSDERRLSASLHE